MGIVVKTGYPSRWLGSSLGWGILFTPGESKSGPNMGIGPYFFPIWGAVWGSSFFWYLYYITGFLSSAYGSRITTIEKSFSDNTGTSELPVS